jgi:hypothetical protein
MATLRIFFVYLDYRAVKGCFVLGNGLPEAQAARIVREVGERGHRITAKFRIYIFSLVIHDVEKTPPCRAHRKALGILRRKFVAWFSRHQVSLVKQP